MNPKAVLLLSLATTAFLPAAVRADLDVAITAEIRLGRALPPPPPEVVVVEEIGPPGPPPWARTRWYRRSHAYYYYPGCDVYYRPADRVWFYLDGGSWRLGPELPARIRVDFDRAVSLHLENDRPYVHHNEIVHYYPANYFTKVRFKNEPGHRPDQIEHRDRDDRGDHHRDGEGKDRGKDRGKGKKAK